MHALPDLEVQSKISRRNGAHFGSSRGSRPSAPRTWPRRRLVRQNCMPGRYFESFRPVGGKITLLRSRRGSLITAWLRLVGGLSPSSPTTQSCATGDFLKVHERLRIGGIC